MKIPLSDTQLTKYFKISCYLECISCVLLFLIAMPLKYSFGITLAMIPAGIIHGLFFTAYLLFTIIVFIKKIYQWDEEDFVFALMSAFFPFATLWVEKVLTKVDRN